MEGALGSEVSENSGIIPRSIHTIFEQLQANKYEDYSVKVSFLELYNEELADLLCEQEERTVSSSMGASSASSKDDSDKKELRIFEDPSGKKGMMVQNLEEVLVESATAVFTLLNKANKNRRVAETNLNARSSRSHYVFTVRCPAPLRFLFLFCFFLLLCDSRIRLTHSAPNMRGGKARCALH